jgi:hypothetical protein
MSNAFRMTSLSHKSMPLAVNFNHCFIGEDDLNKWESLQKRYRKMELEPDKIVQKRTVIW